MARAQEFEARNPETAYVQKTFWIANVRSTFEIPWGPSSRPGFSFFP
jgi:hypothetical protein